MTPAWRRLWIWIAALVPALLLLLVARAFELPAALRAQTVPLSGEWMLHEGDDPRFAAPDLDVSDWRPFTVPGSFFAAGIRGPTAWLRREVELPTALNGRDLFLMLGNPRGGLAQIFVNGHAVGAYGFFDARVRMEFDIGDGWLVHADRWRPGRNVIAMRFWWEGSYNGLATEANYIGPADALGLHFAATRMVQTALPYGTAVTFLFVMLLMIAFIVVEGPHGDRFRYGSILALTVSALFYVAGVSGVGVGPWVTLETRLLTPYFGPILINATFLEFLEHYTLGRVSRFRQVNRALTLAFVVAGVAEAYRFEIFIGFSAVLACSMAYMTVLVVRLVRSGTKPLSPLLAGAVLTTIVTAIVDLAGNVDLISAPRLFVLGLANIPLVSTVVVVADFLAISTINKELSRSLGAANTQLSTALRAAQEAVRIKGEFLANVSHELRTPLNHIINIPEGILEGFAWVTAVRCPSCAETFVYEGEGELDSDTPCPTCGHVGLETSRVRQYAGEATELAPLLETVQQSGHALLSVVDQMLDMSNLEAGSMQLELRPVPAAQVVMDARAAAQPWADEAGVPLQVGADVEHIIVADRAKITQVLVSLLDNAIRFSKRGGVVEVRVSADARACFIAVRDEGIGIDKAHHQAIFESFRQVDGRHTRRHGGTGLGLSISKGIVELHGGEIEVDSALGAGATFTVRIPLAPPLS